MEAVVLTDPIQSRQFNLNFGRDLGPSELRIRRHPTSRTHESDMQTGIRGAVSVNIGAAEEFRRVGVVIEAGPNADGMEPGAWVYQVRRGSETEYHAGGWEFVIDESENWIPIANQVIEFAPMIDPLAIAEKALHEICHMSERLPMAWGNGASSKHERAHRALVIGAGIPGLVAAMALTEGSFETWILPQGEVTPGERIAAELIDATLIEPEKNRGRLPVDAPEVHLIYDASSDPLAALDAMDALACEGIAVFAQANNWSSAAPADLARVMHALLLKGQVAFGAMRPTSSSYHDAIHDIEVFLRRWPEALRALVAITPAQQTEVAQTLEYCQAG
jgi:hypothetical protein